MLRLVIRTALFAGLVAAAFAGSSSSVYAQGPCPGGVCLERDHGHPNLFYNFYVPPTCGGLGSTLYLSPYPVPASVGHTYITYQPLMPHEFMYPHQKTYYRYYNGGRGMTRASVSYTHVPVLTKVGRGLSIFRVAR